VQKVEDVSLLVVDRRPQVRHFVATANLQSFAVLEVDTARLCSQPQDVFGHLRMAVCRIVEIVRGVVEDVVEREGNCNLVALVHTVRGQDFQCKSFPRHLDQ
jgi:hypothetical protein